VDADPDPLNTARDISADDLVTEVRGLAARHVVVISDSCFSGDLSRDAGDLSTSDGNEAYIKPYAARPISYPHGQRQRRTRFGLRLRGPFRLRRALLQTMQSRSEQAFTADDLFVSIRKSVLARPGQSPQYS
jgi:hypothetical protein